MLGRYMSTTRIAVIGAGFSGTLLTLHLLRQCPTAEIVLIERNPQFGRGQAYATGNANHLLNVPAGRMSAFRDRPNNFLEWLQSTPHPELGEAPTAGSFVPRLLFGRYIRHLLKEQIRHADKDGRLELVRGDVLRMDASDSRLALELDRDRRTVADATVLAVGNFPPEPPPVADPGFYDSALYRADPWAPDALTDLDPEAPVLLIGTGLTMIDTVVSLLDQGHTGPIHALSRRGLLPHRHNGSGQPPRNEPSSYPTVLSDLVRLMRREITRMTGLGGTWHPVIDALRPITTELWQTASAEDKARFVRHLRPWWDIHRHRIAADVSDRIEAARERGQLTKCAGRIREYPGDAGGRRGHVPAARHILAGLLPGRAGGELLRAVLRLRPHHASSDSQPAGRGARAPRPAAPRPGCHDDLRRAGPAGRDLPPRLRGRAGDQGRLLGNDRGARHPAANRTAGGTSRQYDRTQGLRIARPCQPQTVMTVAAPLT